MIAEDVKQVPVVEALAGWDTTSVVDARRINGQLVLEIVPDRLVEVCRFLKDHQKFNRLSAVTAIDRYPSDPRFEVVYQLHSLSSGERLRVKCMLAEKDPEIDSVYPVWRSANWYEREVFDLFGIGFRNHPDLRRIMMPESWQGHPLRKDYPVHGHRYDYATEQ